MNKEVEKKLVELLVSPTSNKVEIAQFLSQNGIDISDEEFDEIIKNSNEHQDISGQVNYSLSPDGSSIAMTDTDDKMSKELKETFVRIPTKEEARFLQDIYYQTQDKRIAIASQLRSLKQNKDSQSAKEENNETNFAFLEWYLEKTMNMEENIKKALEAFSDSYYISRWAKQNCGIGPVISTVLAANLEIKENMHAGNWWSYCGLNDNNRPWLGREKAKQIIDRCIHENNGVLDDFTVYKVAAETKWKIGYLEGKAKEKKGWDKDKLIKACSMIPYNKSLKVLMYKIGHSFRMVKNNPDSLYGRILKEREAYEVSNNEAGKYTEQASNILATKNIGKTKTAYKYYSEGKLPPAHISQRAERYATKLFISHLFEAAWYNKYNEQCPEPYIIGFADNGHNDYIKPEVAYESIKRD